MTTELNSRAYKFIILQKVGKPINDKHGVVVKNGTARQILKIVVSHWILPSERNWKEQVFG